MEQKKSFKLKFIFNIILVQLPPVVLLVLRVLISSSTRSYWNA